MVSSEGNLENSTFDLSLSESVQIKGIALLLLLTHHLFMFRNGLYSDIEISNHGLVNEIGQIAKVCVAIFVSLSGYGLGLKYKSSKVDILPFYKRRFTKLYKGYWLIWILFVPLGVFCFGRTLESVYNDDVVWDNLLINLIGLQDFTQTGSYNATWWFMSCIIAFYLFFPLIIVVMKTNFSWVLLILSCMLLFCNIPNLYCVTLYLASFLIGIMLALDNFKRLLDYFYAFDRRGIMIILLSVLIVMTCVLRQSSLRICGMLVDPFLAVEIICFYKLLNIKDCLFTKGLFFLGKHSMNIFLFHTLFLVLF